MKRTGTTIHLRGKDAKAFMDAISADKPTAAAVRAEEAKAFSVLASGVSYYTTLEFFPAETHAVRVGKEVLCRFKSGNYMVCRLETREGKPVWAIPPGWAGQLNAFWPADAVEAFAFLPGPEAGEVPNAG